MVRVIDGHGASGGAIGAPDGCCQLDCPPEKQKEEWHQHFWQVRPTAEGILNVYSEGTSVWRGHLAIWSCDLWLVVTVTSSTRWWGHFYELTFVPRVLSSLKKEKNWVFRNIWQTRTFYKKRYFNTFSLYKINRQISSLFWLLSIIVSYKNCPHVNERILLQCALSRKGQKGPAYRRSFLTFPRESAL